ncbi:MAG: J domain-containing protein, partial [Candidatus Limnocylindrales bacterium]
MAPNGDPYRTLELSRGATLAEVKQAYRRLVKANHPDRAGEAALPRFLAIQAAYDEIVGPDGRARPAAAGGAASGRPARPGPRRPWDADPGRAGATYRAYGGRPRRP